MKQSRHRIDILRVHGHAADVHVLNQQLTAYPLNAPSRQEVAKATFGLGFHEVVGQQGRRGFGCRIEVMHLYGREGASRGEA